MRSPLAQFVMSRDSPMPQSALKALSRALDIRISGRCSSSVNRTRPETFSLRMRFSNRKYSFCSVSSRQSSRATVAITGIPTQSNPCSASFSILCAPPRPGLSTSAENTTREATRAPQEPDGFLDRTAFSGVPLPLNRGTAPLAIQQKAGGRRRLSLPPPEPTFPDLLR